MNNNKAWIWILAVVIVIAAILLIKWNSVPEVNDGTASGTVEEGVAEGEPNASGSGQPAAPEMTASGAYVVHYYKSGFSPKSLVIARGKSVHFINNSSDALQISAVDQTNQPYAGLDQGKSIGIGASYDYTFTTVGSYTYYNFNHKEDAAVITVKP